MHAVTRVSRPLRRAFALGIILAVTATAAAAQDCVRYEDYIHTIADLVIPGTADDVCMDGGLAYVAAGADGLFIVDLSDPSSPRIVGSIDTPGNALSVTVRAPYAFVADEMSGLQVIDVSDPSRPIITGSVTGFGSARGVAVDGDFAYVAAAGFGLRVIDITDPSHPALVGSADTPGYAYDVVIRPPYAFIADDYLGVAVVRIGNPLAPEFVTSVDTPGEAHRLALGGSRVYLADGTGGIQIVNVSIPSGPWLEAAVPLAGRCEDVFAGEGLVYAAVGLNSSGVVEYGICTVGVTDPANPVILGRFYTRDASTAVAVGNGVACLAQGEDGVRLLDVGNPASPSPIATLDFPHCLSVKVVHNIAYIGCRDLEIVDVSDPFSPVHLATASTSDYASNVDVVGGIACVDAFNWLDVFDVVDPADPKPLGRAAVPFIRRVALTGDIACVAALDGFYVVDIRAEGGPAVVGHLQYMWADAVAAEGRYAYISAPTGDATFLVVDLSVPSNPVVVASLAAPSYSDIRLNGDIAYAAMGRGVDFIDISDPLHPMFAGHVTAPGPKAVAGAGPAVYAVTLRSLEVITGSNPLSARLVGAAWVPQYAEGLDFENGLVYVANRDQGLRIFEDECLNPAGASDPGSGSPSGRAGIARAWPNPFITSTAIRFLTDREGDSRIHVLDPSGRVVRTFGTTGRSRSEVEVIWDACDDAGRRLPSGIYFIRIDGRVAGRAVLIR